MDVALNKISQFFWGPWTISFMLFAGVWFSFKLKFFQIFKIHIWLSNTIGRIIKTKNKNFQNNNNKGISSFQAVSTALAGCVGTSNIVGVGLAIAIGGAGSLFWMWVAAFFGMMTSFAENVLAVKYRQTDDNGNFYGGPMIYIEKGMKCKALAIAFSISCIFVSFCGGNMTQSNAMSTAINEIFKIPTFLIGLINALLVALVIFGGIQRISKVSEKLVPIMSAVYVFFGIIIMLLNFNKIFDVFSIILSSAFDFRAVGGSLFSCAAMKTLRSGISRGLSSNEAGLGSSPIIYAATKTKELATQGMWGIFQVFVDTLVVCNITGFCILITGVDQNENYNLLGQAAFNSVFGPFGNVLLNLILILFAFSTIISCAYQGERCVEYVFGRKYIALYKIINICMTIIGSISKINLVWEICDIFNALMMILNLSAVLFLSDQVVKIMEKYLKTKPI